MENTQVIFSWKAPLRPYKKRPGSVLRFYLAVAFLLSLIVYFFGDTILFIPIWSVLFLFYALTISPPPEIENKITRFGLETAGITFRWESLSHFYFTRRFGFQKHRRFVRIQVCAFLRQAGNGMWMMICYKRSLPGAASSKSTLARLF